MPTQIQNERGDVLIEQLDFTPTVGEIVRVDSKDYVVTARKPRTEQVSLGDLGNRYMKIVEVKPAQQESRPGRGPLQEG